MALLESYVAEPPPLVETEQGAIRMRGTRIPLDAVVHSYNSGATPEQIVQSYPPLNLRDVYAAITYYLYIERRVTEADDMERRVGAHQASNEEFRTRLLVRRVMPHLCGQIPVGSRSVGGGTATASEECNES